MTEKKKRGRPFKHELLKMGDMLQVLTGGEYHSERTLRNLCYRQKAIGVLQAMQRSSDVTVKKAAEFWIGRFNKTQQGLKTLFDELGKIDSTPKIRDLLITAHELVEEDKLTMTELKNIVRAKHRAIPNDVS